MASKSLKRKRFVFRLEDLAQLGSAVAAVGELN